MAFKPAVSATMPVFGMAAEVPSPLSPGGDYFVLDFPLDNRCVSGTVAVDEIGNGSSGLQHAAQMLP